MLQRPRQWSRLLLLLGCLPLAAGCGDKDDATTTDASTGAGNTSTTSAASTDTSSTGVSSTDASSTAPTTGAPGSTTVDPTGGPDGTSSGTSGGITGGPVCETACRADADCMVGFSDVGFVCEAGRCVDAIADCMYDGECFARHSPWGLTCTSQVDGSCVPVQQLCVDVGGGKGRCADARQMLVACEDTGQVEIVMRTIEDDQDVIVCGFDDFVCQDGACVDPCKLDGECMYFEGARSVCAGA